MKRIIMMALVICFTCISTCMAAARLDYKYDWQVGPIKMGSQLDMNENYRLFGKLLNVESENKRFGGQIYTFKTLTFERAIVKTRDFTVLGITSCATHDAQGNYLATPRGVVAGHNISVAIQQYGEPPYGTPKAVNGIRKYRYEAEGAYIAFDVNDEGTIVRMHLGFYGC